VIAIVMGVSGVGKTTIGEPLARALGWQFLDGDDFHPPQNVAKMAAGVALQDADRWPWLERLNAELRRIEAAGRSAVLACSALREAYRQRLTDELRAVRIVYLHGGFELIRRRLEERRHRYMPASLLQSQFDTLEPPRDAIAVDVSASLEECVAEAAAALQHDLRTP